MGLHTRVHVLATSCLQATQNKACLAWHGLVWYVFGVSTMLSGIKHVVKLEAISPKLVHKHWFNFGVHMCLGQQDCKIKKRGAGLELNFEKERCIWMCVCGQCMFMRVGLLHVHGYARVAGMFCVVECCTMGLQRCCIA